MGDPDDAMRASTAIVIIGEPLLHLSGLTASAGMTPLVLFAMTTAALVATAAWETVTRVRSGGDDTQAGQGDSGHLGNDVRLACERALAAGEVTGGRASHGYRGCSRAGQRKL